VIREQGAQDMQRSLDDSNPALAGRHPVRPSQIDPAFAAAFGDKTQLPRSCAQVACMRGSDGGDPIWPTLGTALSGVRCGIDIYRQGRAGASALHSPAEAMTTRQSDHPRSALEAIEPFSPKRLKLEKGD